MSKKLTLYDLARAAKVSPATVSRVVAGNPTVTPAIRIQVHKAAEKLGMDLEERRKAKSKIIAFLLGNRDLLHSFQARVLLGAEMYCSQQKWELMFMSFHYQPEIPPEALHLPQLLSNSTNARAVILGGSNFPNLLAALNARGIPFAVLGNNVSDGWTPANCDVAYSDDINGAHEATVYLISHGHRSIGFIGNRQLPWFKRCSVGYGRAMAESKLEPIFADIRSDDSSQLGYLGAKSLLTRNEAITAILAGSDQVASGVYDAAREMGLTIPEHLSVVGFNDTQGSLFSPPLTTVREFPEELGRHLAEFVLKRLQNPCLSPQELTIPTQLVQRESVRSLPVGAGGNGEDRIALRRRLDAGRTPPVQPDRAGSAPRSSPDYQPHGRNQYADNRAADEKSL